jgi:AraC-like DNA-binding protein
MLPYAYLLTILMFLSAFIGMLASVILAFVNKVQPLANRLLGISLFGVSYFAIISALLVNHAIGEVPHLFRTAAPLQYLVAPCAYLYVRTVLYQESHLRRYDWLHFVPFFLHVIELTPFFLHSAEYKSHYLQFLSTISMGAIKQQEGWLPAYYHPVLKFLLGNAYVLLQWRLIRQFVKKSHPVKAVRMRWLKTFSWLNTLLYPPILMAMFTPVSTQSVLIFSILIWVNYLLITSLLLFFRPCILYGTAPLQAPTEEPEAIVLPKEDPEITRVYVLSQEKKQEYRQKVEQYMTETQPFLRKGYCIRDLAVESEIPQHHLSALINQEYRMNFSDFINQYRVAYVKQKMRQPEWRQLTLEGIAQEAGFSNRTTFFRAFTKLTGTTPSEYLSRESSPS